MRVLFTTSPGLGHVFPTVRTAQAFQAAGHEVLYALGGYVEMTAAAGMAVVDTAPGVDFAEIFRRFVGKDQQLVVDSGDARTPAQLFAQISEVTVEGTVAVATEWKPDVVVHSPFQGAGQLVASYCGVPAVEHGIGLGSTGMFGQVLREEMRESYDRYGISQEPPITARVEVAPESMIHTTPEAAAPTGPVWPVRYVPYNGGGVLPDWLINVPRRPRIALTMGTVLPRMGRLGGLSALLAAAGKIDAEFVLALGKIDAAKLPSPPDNVRVCVEWIPLGWLLRTCVAAVHHGGAGTTLTTLDAGIPQLVLPHGADQYINAEAVRARGVGHVSDLASIDTGTIERLLTDAAASTAATEVRAEMAATPAPSDVIPRVVDLVQHRAHAGG